MARTRSKGSVSTQRPADDTTRTGGATGRVHLYVGVSLDGYVAGPDGQLDWLTPYADARSGFASFIKTISACIMGRTTYDHAVRNSGGGDPGFGMASYVLTHRPLETPTRDVVAFRGDLVALVALLRQKHGHGDFWLMGGGIVTRSFIDADLIDIYSIAFVPTLISAGRPMFPPGAFAEKRLKLVRQHTYPSGVIEMRCERG
jgi:dihydrofolate reductase